MGNGDKRSSSFFFRTPKLLTYHFTNLELLYLASDGHREGIDKVGVARHFIMRDLALAIAAYLVFFSF